MGAQYRADLSDSYHNHLISRLSFPFFDGVYIAESTNDQLHILLFDFIFYGVWNCIIVWCPGRYDLTPVTCRITSFSLLRITCVRGVVLLASTIPLYRRRCVFSRPTLPTFCRMFHKRSELWWLIYDALYQKMIIEV